MGRVIRIADRNYVLRKRDWTAMLLSGCLYAKRPTGCMSERMDGDGAPGRKRMARLARCTRQTPAQLKEEMDYVRRSGFELVADGK